MFACLLKGIVVRNGTSKSIRRIPITYIHMKSFQPVNLLPCRRVNQHLASVAWQRDMRQYKTFLIESLWSTLIALVFVRWKLIISRDISEEKLDNFRQTNVYDIEWTLLTSKLFVRVCLSCIVHIVVLWPPAREWKNSTRASSLGGTLQTAHPAS